MKAKQMLDEYMKEFEKRNPNMKVFNAVMHLDEATPHLHIDFLPVCHNQKQGLSTRISMKKALEEQGFISSSKRISEWAVWATAEKEIMTSILKHHGLSRDVKNAHMECEEYRQSRKELEKLNNPDTINPSITRTREEPEESCVPAADMIDGMDFEQLKEERACYAQIVRDNTDYDILVEQFPEQADEINELISIMVDVICSQKKTIRANGEEKPHDVVKSRLLKLNSSHIEYVLAALKKNTSDVRNIRSYLITALYNAPVTMSSFYRAEVNHDMFGNADFSFSVLK